MIIPSLSAARTMCEVRDWRISNLELQKLLFLAQMTALGRSDGDMSLVNDSFEAWDYGPVLPTVYHRAKAFGSKNVPNVFRIAEPYTGSRREIIEEVSSEFSGWDAGQLVSLTHRDGGAWASHYIPRTRGIRIPTEDIIREYRELVD